MIRIIKIFISCAILIIFPLSYLLSQAHYIYPQTEKYRFRHLTTDDGLPTNWCYQVIKDSKGFIWITTRAGLCRYDGYNIKVFQNDPSDSTSISHNRIKKKECIIEDQAGNIWIGTLNGLNRYDPTTGTFHRYYHDSTIKESISSNIIACLLEDKSGIIWIGTGSNGGLNRYNSSNNTFTDFKPELEDQLAGTLVFQSLFEDNMGRFWVGTSNGIYLFSKEMGDFMYVAVDSTYSDVKNPPNCRSIHEDNDGTIFFGTPQGFIIYDTNSNKLKPYQPLFHSNLNIRNTDLLANNFDNKYTHWIISIVGLYGFNKHTSYLARVRPDPNDDQSISGNSLKSIYRDETGLLWIPGNFGVNILDPIRQKIINFPGLPGDYGEATCFYEDSKKFLWKGSDHLEKLDSNLNQIEEYQFPLDDTGKITFSGAVFAILEDKHGNMWVGNDYNGLYILENGSSGLVKCKFTNANVTYIWDILQDASGNIWVGTNYGLFYKGSEINTFSEFTKYPAQGILAKSVIVDIAEDKNGDLWIATAGNGLFKRSFENRNNDHFVRFIHDPWDKYSLSSNRIWAIHEDKEGTLWIATEHGLNKQLDSENKFLHYLNFSDPSVNFIYDLTDDRNGSLWLTTEGGLIQFIPDKEQTGAISSGVYRKVLAFDDIFPYRIYRSKSGNLFLGGAYNSGKGYYHFHPDSILKNSHIPPIVLTDFKVDNIRLILDTTITYKKNITLKHNQNFFSIEFSALDFLDPDKNQYAHYLEGFENEWVNTENNRIANYTDVPPGDYIFHVKGSNNNGIWNNQGRSIAITILPPPWETWWAYTLYIISITFLIYVGIRFYLRRLQLLHKLKMEQLEANKMKELDSMKSQFFANISHEFRTPLTLILGPLEKTLSSVKGELKNNLLLIQRNALKLQKLINEILSLSKLESGQMTLHAQEVNIVRTAKIYLQQFESLAIQRKISLKFSSEKEEILVYIELEKFETILFNLLSNAFKFTPEGGEISICFIENNKDDASITFTVSDTGIGIPAEQLLYVFDRFYRVNEVGVKDQEGTGIGLALTKELVELHHGHIWVESEPYSGTIFTIKLPLGKGHLKEEELILVDGSKLTGDSQGLILETETLNSKSEISDLESGIKSDQSLLLIVEDNPDMRYYIRSNISDDYRIIEAENGKKGFELATEKIPDLIISDVMMPEMDGFEYCKKLKTDERTSHIPVILLTAKAGIESKVEGLETGADDYITKPYDSRELNIRIKNLLELRRKLQDRFVEESKKSDLSSIIRLSESGITSIDQKFLQKAINILNANFSDADFTVKKFCNEMAMSNMQLHRKLVAITGLTANKFIRSYRLKRAAQLLSKKAGNITEIAYEVGFNNLSWFAKCFHEQFGITPSEYISKHKKM